MFIGVGISCKFKVIHTNQSGFRQKYSCQTALVKSIDQRMTCIDIGDKVGSVFLDFRKAFDLFSSTNFPYTNAKLISSYLQSR